MVDSRHLRIAAAAEFSMRWRIHEMRKGPLLRRTFLRGVLNPQQ